MYRTNILVGIRVFLSHNKMFVFLCCWTYLFMTLGAVCAARCDTVCSLLGVASGGFVGCFLLLLMLAIAYLLLFAVSTVFLLGPMLTIPAVALIGLAIGFCGYSSVYMYGWTGLLANAAICLPLSCLFIFYMFHAARTVNLSLSMGRKLFGNSNGVIFSTEIKRYLIMLAVMTPVTLSLAAVVSLILTLFAKFL